MTEVNNLYPLETLLKYRDSILVNIESKNNSLVLNDSVMHASLIMSGILQKAKKIEMYCGKFSVFRQDFKQKIETMLSNSIYDTVRETDSFQKFNPYNNSIAALQDFFDRGGKMSVVLENDIQGIENEEIWKAKIQPYIESGAISFYRRNDSSDGLSHFLVASIDSDTYPIYRNEYGKEQRTAICNFGDTSLGSAFHKCFTVIQRDSAIIFQ